MLFSCPESCRSPTFSASRSRRAVQAYTNRVSRAVVVPNGRRGVVGFLVCGLQGEVASADNVYRLAPQRILVVTGIDKHMAS